MTFKWEPRCNLCASRRQAANLAAFSWNLARALLFRLYPLWLEEGILTMWKCMLHVIGILDQHEESGSDGCMSTQISANMNASDIKLGTKFPVFSAQIKFICHAYSPRKWIVNFINAFCMRRIQARTFWLQHIVSHLKYLSSAQILFRSDHKHRSYSTYLNTAVLPLLVCFNFCKCACACVKAIATYSQGLRD